MRRGALPVGADSGLLDIRDRALPLEDVSGDRPRPWPERSMRATSTRASSTRSCPSSTPKLWSPSASSSTPPTGWPGDAAAHPRPAAARRRALLLRAGRELSQSRAEPTARGEPRVHRREGQGGGRGPRDRLRRRRRPLLLRGRHRRVRARRLRHGPAGRVDAREAPRRDDHLRRPRELGRPRHGRAAGRHGGDEPRRPRLHQAPHARGGRVRGRGERPLLLPRLLPGRSGTIPALLVLELVSRRGQKLSELLRPLASATSSPARSTPPSPTSPSPCSGSRSTSPTRARSPTSTASPSPRRTGT